MPALVGRRDPLFGPQREDRVEEIVPFETLLQGPFRNPLADPYQLMRHKRAL